MTDEDLAELHYSVYEAIEDARLYPHRLTELFNEYRARALNGEITEREFWLSACKKVNEVLERYEFSRKVGTTFADNELPQRSD